MRDTHSRFIVTITRHPRVPCATLTFQYQVPVVACGQFVASPWPNAPVVRTQYNIVTLSSVYQCTVVSPHVALVELAD